LSKPPEYLHVAIDDHSRIPFAKATSSERKRCATAFLMLETRLEQAKASGELPAIFDCAVAAQIIVTYLQGFYRVVRVLHDRRQMEQQIETLLRGLGL
jgi:hypothetical protein